MLETYLYGPTFHSSMPIWLCQFTLHRLFYMDINFYLPISTEQSLLNQRTSPLLMYIQNSKTYRKDYGGSKKSVFLPSQFWTYWNVLTWHKNIQRRHSPYWIRQFIRLLISMSRTWTWIYMHCLMLWILHACSLRSAGPLILLVSNWQLAQC